MEQCRRKLVTPANEVVANWRFDSRWCRRSRPWRPAVLLWVAGLLSWGGQSQKPSPENASVPNVQITHTGTYEESALAVNPADPRNLLGISMFTSDASAPGSQPATFSSFDAGATWRENGPLPLPEGFAKGVDPSVAFSSSGHGFLAYRLDGAGEVGARPQGIFVWRTDDGGRVFSAPQPAFLTHGAPGIDHPWIAAGKADSAAADLYVVWTMEPDGKPAFTAFSRSTGGGAFELPQRISGPNDRMAANPVVAAGPDAWVHVVYTSFPSGQSSPSGLRDVKVVSSSDGGRHFDRPKIVGKTLTLAGTTARLPTSPALGVDPLTDAVYVAYALSRGETKQSDIAVVYSVDHGQSWSQPALITGSRSAAETGYFQPSAAVAPQGIVCVSYYKLTNVSKELNQSLMDEYLSCSTNHGKTFGQALRISTESFKYGLGNPFTFRGGEFRSFGDYQGLAAGPTAIHVLWSDSRPGQTAMFSAAVPIGRFHR